MTLWLARIFQRITGYFIAKAERDERKAAQKYPAAVDETDPLDPRGRWPR